MLSGTKSGLKLPGLGRNRLIEKYMELVQHNNLSGSGNYLTPSGANLLIVEGMGGGAGGGPGGATASSANFRGGGVGGGSGAYGVLFFWEPLAATYAYSVGGSAEGTTGFTGEGGSSSSSISSGGNAGNKGNDCIWGEYTFPGGESTANTVPQVTIPTNDLRTHALAAFAFNAPVEFKRLAQGGTRANGGSGVATTPVTNILSSAPGGSGGHKNISGVALEGGRGGDVTNISNTGPAPGAANQAGNGSNGATANNAVFLPNPEDGLIITGAQGGAGGGAGVGGNGGHGAAGGYPGGGGGGGGSSQGGAGGNGGAGAAGMLRVWAFFVRPWK